MFLTLGSGALMAGGLWGEASPVAETAYGRVRGTTVRGVHTYRGIPHGGPAEGQGRFLPPSKPAPWKGTRDATTAGPRCVQFPGNLFTSTVVGEYFSGGRPDRAEISSQVDSENCLVVNVLTPGLSGKRPVMVYIHGGGFTGGSSALTLFCDRFVREQDVVLVGVNHRLNVFGYTYLGGLSSKYTTGNAGQLDLVAALDWVRGNISQFGGDAANVTIFGESGGGAKISALLAMPAARGLFQKASIQSGSALRAATAEQATESARKLLANLGLTDKQVGELEKVPAERLLVAGKGGGLVELGAVVDGHSVATQTWDPHAPAASASVPLLIGNDKDEGTLFALGEDAPFHLDDAGLRERLLQMHFPEGKVDSTLGVYRQHHPGESPSELYFRISTDRGARYNAVKQAELKLAQGKAPVYVWYCQWNTPLGMGDKKLGAFHTCDLPLSMRLTRFPESEQLSRQLSTAWAAFARTGSPSTQELAWPKYSLPQRTTMVWDVAHSQAVDDPDGEERIAVRDSPSGSLL